MTRDPQAALDQVLAALQRSHERFVAALSGLGADELSGPSYDDDWTIAQVASHLGSGAEIHQRYITAGQQGTAAPGLEQIKPIWDEWNAKSPTAQAVSAVEADQALLRQVAGLSAQDRASWSLELFGAPRDLAAALKLRLSEHAVHTWDIVVAAEPSAVVADDATALIIDELGMLVGYAGKGAPEPLDIVVETTDPSRSMLLALTTDGARLDAEAGVATEAAARLRLPAEAFVRLVYGRLDPAHTPPNVNADGVDLDLLRRTFPGV